MTLEQDSLARADGDLPFRASSSSIAQDESYEAICRLIQWFVELREKWRGILSKAISLEPAISLLRIN